MAGGVISQTVLNVWLAAREAALSKPSSHSRNVERVYDWQTSIAATAMRLLRKFRGSGYLSPVAVVISCSSLGEKRGML